jgi:hypothetical protein
MIGNCLTQHSHERITLEEMYAVLQPLVTDMYDLPQLSVAVIDVRKK